MKVKTAEKLYSVLFIIFMLIGFSGSYKFGFDNGKSEKFSKNDIKLEKLLKKCIGENDD